MLVRCERCGKENYKLYECYYCKRKIGKECIKSTKRVKDILIVICDDCWTNSQYRNHFKGLSRKDI